MKYTTEEKARMDSLMDIFREYVSECPYTNLFFSDRLGYIQVSIEDEPVREFEDADDLFEFILFEMSSDVRDLFLCGEHVLIDLYPEEIDETRVRMQPYLDRMPEGERRHFTEVMEDYFAHCNDLI